MQDRTCWIIKHHCSASPRLLALVFASMVALSFAFGVAFALMGLWGVLPFVGLELAAVAFAFLVHGRHVADYERIELGAGQVRVEHHAAARSTVTQLTLPWTRVEVDGTGAGLRADVRVFLADGRQRIEVGRALAGSRRASLARELKLALRAPAAG